jgi:hypothetical protein
MMRYEKNDWSDRKLKLAILLAIAVIGWLYWKGAGANRDQAAPANLTLGLPHAVKHDISTGS